MEPLSSNIKRNQLFIYLYGCAALLHLFGRWLFTPETGYASPIFGLLTFGILWMLHTLQLNVRLIQILILASMNIYVFMLNFESLSAVTVIYFVIPIIASALYYDTFPNIVFGFITFTEILLLAFVFNELDGRASITYIHVSLFTFVSSVLILTTIHSIYFSRIWSQLEQKNKTMEKALISKEGYLQLFFETAKDAIAVYDSNNRIIAINPAFEKLYGWTSEECIGEPLRLYPLENAENAEYRTRHVQEGGSYSLLETEDVKKDGTRFLAQITLSPITDQNGNVVATSVISRDISYQKEAEKLILQSEKLKLAGEIAAGVAHEIRNPMTVISGFVQMMQSDPDYPYKEYTKLIRSELDRINLIISEFLVLAKPQASSFKKVSLRKILDETIALFGPELNLHGILFDYCWELEDFIIEGEEHRIKQVLINLMKNAIEASQNPGEISLIVELRDENSVAIQLQDHGKGISKEEFGQIFEPFYTTKETGTGLGLIVSQKIIQEHGGTLTIESEPGCGTLVTVILPIK
ncbi:Sporulation kinase A [Planococcus massiliensis]|uniref:histidine kinase n=1 Tax=Planococcus massiliensis TaxID=1499687 RepID=A0A098ELY2_9BACL|nr:ATP-binding protein [Planococcus massiliensis]CEG22296.1 Sporulation kinase A [Planococcus massiliensis]